MDKANKGAENKEKSPFTEIFIKLIKGKTQQEVADLVGVSRQNVGAWIKGDSVPSIYALPKIAEAFNVSTDYLLGRGKIKSDDEDVKIACKVTHLSESTIKYLAGVRDLLSIKTADVFINELCGCLFTVGNYFINRCKYKALRTALFRKFVFDNNLPVTPEMLEKREEKAFFYAFENEDEAIHYYNEFLYFLDDNKQIFKHNLQVDNEKYLKFLSNEIIEHVIEQAYSEFQFCEFENNEILDYYVNYYQRFLNCNDEAEKLAIEIEEINFRNRITRSHFYTKQDIL